MWAEDNLYTINLYLPSITKFIYAISFIVVQITTELTSFFFEKDYFCICSKTWFVS